LITIPHTIKAHAGSFVLTILWLTHYFSNRTASGPADIDQDGPALIGDPDMGFAGLRQFGPALVHHTCLRVRSGIATNSFMLVDSPGMIDSPVSATFDICVLCKCW
jgi:hypothetical protein